MQLLNYTEHAASLAIINRDYPFSFQKSYAAFIERTGASLFILKKDSVLAPVILKKSKFLRILQFHFKPLGAGAQELSTQEEQGFLEEALSYISTQKLAHRIVQPVNFALFSAVPQSSISAPYGSYVINLKELNDESLLAGMQARYRTAVRASQKLNPEVRTGNGELKNFWELHKATMERTGAYAEPYHEIKDLLETSDHTVLIANCYINNELQGGVCIAWSHYGAYYLHGASGNSPMSDGAIKYLHYWCMCHLKQQGAERYDFVGARLSDVSGTKLEGIQNFKKRFGSELKAGYLWKKDISPFVCAAYDSLLLLKLTLKGLKTPKDIIDQERNK
jgi:hypothetical protein